MLLVIRRKSDGLYANRHGTFGKLQFARKFTRQSHVKVHVDNIRHTAKQHRMKFVYTDCEVVQMELAEVKSEDIK